MRLRDPQVFFQDAAASSLVPSPHGVRHVIRTVGQPATTKFRRLDPTWLAAAKREFQSMLDEGVIRCSSSQWSSPLHMVQKPYGSWRPCGDYRQLNLQTVEDKHPLPNMADLAARLDRCKLFSKLDLQKGYLQVPVAVKDIAKTVIITPFGLFEFTRMPFGLRNAGMTFQRLMDSVLGNLPFAFVYLDDILVAAWIRAPIGGTWRRSSPFFRATGSLSTATSACSAAQRWIFWDIASPPRGSAHCPPGFRPSPNSRSRPPSNICRPFWASSTSTGGLSQRRHGLSNHSPGRCLAAPKVPRHWCGQRQ